MARMKWITKENHGDHQFSPEAFAETDLYLSVSPLWAIPLLWGDCPHDSFRLPVWRSKLKEGFHKFNIVTQFAACLPVLIMLILT